MLSRPADAKLDGIKRIAEMARTRQGERGGVQARRSFRSPGASRRRRQGQSGKAWDEDRRRVVLRFKVFPIPYEAQIETLSGRAEPGASSTRKRRDDGKKVDESEERVHQESQWPLTAGPRATTGRMAATVADQPARRMSLVGDTTTGTAPWR